MPDHDHPAQPSWPLPLLASVFLSLGILLGSGCNATPSPSIAIPPDLSRFDPQLKATIELQLRQVSEKPRDAERHATLGLIYAANDLWSSAAACFSNVVSLAPNEPHGLLYAGVSAQELGNAQGASASFDTLTRQHPSFAPGWYRRGELALHQGLLPRATESFQRVVELSPNEWRGPFGLADIAFRQGKYTSAVTLLERTLSLEPHAMPAHHLLGQALQQLGKTNASAWQLALGRSATSSPMPDAWSTQAAQYTLALTDQFSHAEELAASGRPQLAVELLKRTLQYHPQNPLVINQLAIAYNRAAKPGQARELLSDLLARDPTQIPAWVTLSFTEAQMERFHEALAAANQAIQLSTNIAQPYLAKANAFLGLERDEDAIEAFRMASQMDAQNPEILLEWSDVLSTNLGRGPEALQLVRRAHELDPGRAKIYPRWVKLELSYGNSSAAATALNSWRQLEPQSPEIAPFEAQLKERRP